MSFLRMSLHFFCLLWMLLLGQQASLACATGEHHSTTFHYNNAQQVFVGVLLQQEKASSIDTTWLTFKVKKAYKNCQVGQLLKIQANAYTTAFIKKRSQHLVYAERTLSTALYCPKLEALKEANTTRQLAVIEQIIQQPKDQEFIEHSPYGTVWARGYYDQGQPCQNWCYYAYSGELKISAQYLQGLPASQWKTYAHTKDEEYKILQQILSGAYTQGENYRVISLDSNLQAEFRYQLQYVVEGDTMTEQFYYNKPYLTQYRHYQEGLKHGLENSFKADGTAYKSYTFQEGKLHGTYREVLSWAREEDQGAYVEVKGKFVGDKREEEVHFYYNGKGDFLYKKVIVEKGKIL